MSAARDQPCSSGTDKQGDAVSNAAEVDEDCCSSIAIASSLNVADWVH